MTKVIKILSLIIFISIQKTFAWDGIAWDNSYINITWPNAK